VQGGDFLFGDGTGSEAVSGGKFVDEGFQHTHDAPGLLSMASCGRDRNGSQFFITAAPLPHLDGKHVVFGRVLLGMEVVRSMLAVPVDEHHRPTAEVTIKECGRLATTRTVGAGDGGADVDRETGVEL